MTTQEIRTAVLYIRLTPNEIKRIVEGIDARSIRKAMKTMKIGWLFPSGRGAKWTRRTPTVHEIRSFLSDHLKGQHWIGGRSRSGGFMVHYEHDKVTVDFTIFPAGEIFKVKGKLTKGSNLYKEHSLDVQNASKGD